MTKVTQVIPNKQVDIIKESLDFLESILSKLDSDDSKIQYKLFDIHVLKAMLNKGEVTINHTIKDYNNFTSNNSIDYPLYY